MHFRNLASTHEAELELLSAYNSYVVSRPPKYTIARLKNNLLVSWRPDLYCSAQDDLGRVRLGMFRNKNVFQNIFRLFCSWEENSQNGIQVFRNENSSQTNAYLHYSNYSYSGLIPNERALFLIHLSRWSDVIIVIFLTIYLTHFAVSICFISNRGV